MVSKYDVLYVIASHDPRRTNNILKALDKPAKDYQRVYNLLVQLEKEGFIQRKPDIVLIQNERTVGLLKLIKFCLDNRINYNLMLTDTMVRFLSQAAKVEFFTIKDVGVDPRTFNLYTTALSQYGLMLITSRKPLTCKLLRHHLIGDLLGHFCFEAEFYEPTDHDLTDLIRKELRTYKRNRRIHGPALADMEKKSKISLIYMSLRMEGNPLTLPETEKLILEDIVPEEHKMMRVQEVTNYEKAVDYMVSNAERKVPLDLQLILEYHKIAMDHIHGAGMIRQQEVKIKGNPKFKTCPWRHIPKRIRELMGSYDKFQSQKRDLEGTIEFASYFHNEFQRIHPFIDGNSRSARLLMVHILRMDGIPVMDLPMGYTDVYMDLTKRSSERDDEGFRRLVEEMVLYSLKRTNSAM